MGATKKNQGKSQAALTFVDLFAGAGLFSCGFENAGFKSLLAVEKDSVAVSTFKKNGLGDIIEEDIRKVSRKIAPKCDVLIAGPPCQGFSTLGLQHSHDPRNKLAYEVVRWAEVCRPQVVVVENVAAFAGTEICESLIRRFESRGFETTVWILDASDFGVAQNRRRSFTIATKRGIPAAPTQRKRKVSVLEAWEGLPSRVGGGGFHIAPKPSPLALARMRVIPEGGDKRDILRNAPHLAPPSWSTCANAVTDVWGRMKWDEPANTLRTCLQNPSKGRYIHPRQHRVISLREAARLHSIPDSWQFDGLPTQIARQIGNGVPPKLAEVVANTVMRLF